MSETFCALAKSYLRLNESLRAERQSLGRGLFHDPSIVNMKKGVDYEDYYEDFISCCDMEDGNYLIVEDRMENAYLRNRREVILTSNGKYYLSYLPRGMKLPPTSIQGQWIQKTDVPNKQHAWSKLGVTYKLTLNDNK